jgi:hypothetical protein
MDGSVPVMAEADRSHLVDPAAEIARRKLQISTLPGDASDPEWVKRKLVLMLEIDQISRSPGASRSLRFEIDQENTRDLIDIVARHGWITRERFGDAAAIAAWAIVQHADANPSFQRQILARLEEGLAAGTVDPRQYAYLFDRVAVGANRPQRYGTQGSCEKPRAWSPLPIEDPAHVDGRRLQMGLAPLSEYRASMSVACP